LHSFKDVLPEFFYHSFKSTFALIALDGSAKSTVDSVRRPMLANLPIPLPPLGEQQQIVDKLREHVAMTSKLREAAEATVSKLLERRESLIATVITGIRKIT
jgi:type I restriction enzyme S subunit